MNKARRAKLAKAAELLSEAMSIIEEARDEEQEAYDNLPESFQCSERGEQMEEYIYGLDEAYDSCSDLIENLETVTEA